MRGSMPRRNQRIRSQRGSPGGKSSTVYPRCKAELLTGDDRAAAWATAVDFYAGYESYRTSCAPPEIRVFRLRPIGA